ncbi:MAG: thioredoxin family protein [Candidatus Aenigmarchaeota archaeon]|nr:thioredoxin family protein [Candidatus Aenigmarchaeota archaeon]
MAMESQAKLKTGDKAPGFSLKGVDGKNYSSSDFSDSEGLLVVFMCNHCPYVKARLDAIIGLQNKFGGKVSIVGINSNDPNYEGEGFENMEKFAKERGINFPYLFDETQEVAKSYGATCTPDPFLFDKSMKLVYHGRINDALTLDGEPKEDIMEDNMNKLLKGEEIAEDFLPSMGCSIKWRQ